MPSRLVLASLLRAVLLALLVPGAALAAPAYTHDNGSSISLGNDSIELQFQKNDGRLTALIDKASGYDFLARKDAYWAPLHFWATLDGRRENIFGGLAVRTSNEIANSATGKILTFKWDGFRVSSGRVLNAAATLAIEVRTDDPLSSWNLSIANRENVTIDQVDCPDLHGLAQISSDATQDYLALPQLTGMLLRDPVHNFPLARGLGYQQYYPSARSTMQFMAYYGTQRRVGLYVAAYDPEANSKYLNVARLNNDWMSLSITHVLPFVNGRDYAPGYPFTVGVFTGDWYDAARIYRKWAVGQSWAQGNTLNERSWTPDWFKRLSLHQWIFTQPSTNPSLVVDVAKDSAAQVGAPAAMDWIGWERNGWYIDYPDVFPPKVGWSAFDDAVSATHAGGNRIMVIPDTTSYSTRLRGWPDAQPNATTTNNVLAGTPPFAYSENGLTTTFPAMCPATTYWRTVLTDLLQTLVSHGADIIQLDGFPSFGPQPCTASDHSHEPGGGHWWVSAYADIFRQVKAAAKAAGRSIVFSAEGMAEPYVSMLDGFWDPFTTGWSPASLNNAYARIEDVQTIPLWHAVYHDYAVLQSGIAFVTRDAPSGSVGYGAFRDYYLHGLGLALVLGEIPTTWYNDAKLSQTSRSDERQMVEDLRRIVQARADYAPQFLVFGQMLKPLDLSVPTLHVAGAKGIPYTLADYPPFDTASIMNGVWRAPNGDVGIVLTNISPDPVSFDVPITSDTTELAAGQVGPMSLVRNGAVESSFAAGAFPFRARMTLNPFDVALLSIRVSNSAAGR